MPATVPGCVHTDLLAAGLIPDPVLGRNEQLLGWVGEADWTYRTRVRRPTSRRTSGSTWCATGSTPSPSSSLNGSPVGATKNMHRSYRFDVGTAARRDNELTVTFRSPVRYAEAMRDQLGDRPGPYPAPFNFIRKMACNFGWDWGPALRHRRHLAADRSACLEHRTAGRRATPGHRLCRRHRRLSTCTSSSSALPTCR